MQARYNDYNRGSISSISGGVAMSPSKASHEIEKASEAEAQTIQEAIQGTRHGLRDIISLCDAHSRYLSAQIELDCVRGEWRHAVDKGEFENAAKLCEQRCQARHRYNLALNYLLRLQKAIPPDKSAR